MTDLQEINKILKNNGLKINKKVKAVKQNRSFNCLNCGTKIEGFFRSDKIYCTDCSSTRSKEIINERR